MCPKVRAAAVGVSSCPPPGCRETWKDSLPAYMKPGNAEASSRPLRMLQDVTATMLAMAGGVRRDAAGQASAPLGDR